MGNITSGGKYRTQIYNLTITTKSMFFVFIFKPVYKIIVNFKINVSKLLKIDIIR